MVKRVEIIGLENFPIIKPGDDIAKIIVEVAKKNNIEILDNDVIVIAQKIVSKAEGRIVNLENIKPSSNALFLAKITNKDPKFIEVVLRESVEVIKCLKGHLIVKTKHGIVCANAGIDRSNVAGSKNIVTLLPEDPDTSAERIRKRIEELTGKKVMVLISDTYGRPLRNGHVNMAIGVAGLKVFRDYRGTKDLFGYTLRVKRIAIADEIASAAELVMGNGNEGIPVVIIRGLSNISGNGSAKELNMPEEKWFFK